MITAAIRNRKRIYEDDTGTLYLWTYNGNVFCDTMLYGPFVLSTYKHWLDVQAAFELEMKERGVSDLHCLVDSLDRYKWVSFLGYESAGETYHTSNGVVEVMRKVI